MASITIVNSRSVIALSSEAHAPHYLGKASYVGSSSFVAIGSISNNTKIPVFVYQVSSQWAPLAFVQLSSFVGYSVRSVYQESAGLWKILVSTTGSASDAPPNVFCFGRIFSAKAGGPAVRLFDSSGGIAFDSQSRPIRVIGCPIFGSLHGGYAQINGSHDSGVDSQPLPVGVVQPAVALDCGGFSVGVAGGNPYTFYDMYVFSYHWKLSGANLLRVQTNHGLECTEDAGNTSAHIDALRPRVIETYGLS